MREICRLQREHMIPMESMQSAMKLFRQHATVPEGGLVFADGELTKADLASVMRQMAGSTNDAIETCLVDSAFSVADKDSNGFITFYEFAIWFSSHSFDEHFNLDAKDLELRKLSRQLDMPLSEIDTYKRHFDSFDTDGNGTMDRTEFYGMLLKCLKVPGHVGLPAGRVQQLWAGADSDGNGVIDFAEFVVFFAKYFPQFGSSGMHQYYCQNGLLNTLHGNFQMACASTTPRTAY
jgi:Ca2+-binding EF-hand superfamily protein